MERQRYDTDFVKNLLDIYLEKEEDIDNQIERLESLDAKMTAAGVQNLTAMPRNPSPSTDRMADLFARKEELEAEIRESISTQNKRRSYIKEIISHIRNSEEIAVIQLKYLDRYKWSEVLEILYSRNPDFDERRESYERRMYRKRNNALENMADYLELFGEPDTAIFSL